MVQSIANLHGHAECQIIASLGKSVNPQGLLAPSILQNVFFADPNGLTVTGIYLIRDLVKRERRHPSIVRRMDDMCKAIKL